MGNPQTHFGYEQVDVTEKTGRVKGVFSSVASNYDIMNDLMSAGMHRLWKDKSVSKVNVGADATLLDVAGGTGDIAVRLHKRTGAIVNVCDINEQMLRAGQDRQLDKGETAKLRWLCGNAESLPLPSNSVDVYTIAFGLRNVTDIPKALREAHRILKPGGQFLCLEFSKVSEPLFAKIYDKYSFKLIPKIGELVAKDRASYQYLVESIRMFPKQRELVKMMETAGFGRVNYENLSLGIVAIHQGWKNLMRDVKYSLRLLRFATILARHDATFVFDIVNLPLPARIFFWLIKKRDSKTNKGVRLANALQKMGPSFIKFGQTLSTRGDLIGAELAEGLTLLQDKLPPFDGAEAKRIIEAELGNTIENLFTWFEHDATAAASIAQVHFATTKDGKDVAVKVLRPNIEAAFARDFELLYWLAEKAAKRLPRLKPVEVIKTFEETIRVELDLRFEAAAAEELKQNTKDDRDFYVVEVDWVRTAKRVLTTERIRGFHASDKAGMEAAGIDVTKITEKAATAFFNQVFRDGFFHADMHPGNLFVLPDGRLAPVDFGIMGRISHQDQLILAEILYGFLKGDFDKVAKVHAEAGWIPAHVSVELFAQACRAIGQPMMGKALNEISVGALFGQLIQVAQMFEMEVQPQLILLQKTMVTAEGVGRGLNPSVNMWQLAEPLITDWARANFAACEAQNLACEALEVLKDAPSVLKELREYLREAQAKAAV